MGKKLKVRIKVYIRTNRQGSQWEETITLDREDFEQMSEEELDEVCRDAAFEMMEWGYCEIT